MSQQQDRVYPVKPVTVSLTVGADPGELFVYVSDTRNDPEWCQNVSGVTQTEGDGVSAGARFDFHQRLVVRGRALESDVSAEIVDLGESHIRWRVEDRFQVRDVLLRVDPEGDGSRVSQTTSAAFKRSPGVARWFYPILARRTFKDQFRSLAERFS